MLLYYITDRKQFRGTELQQRESLLAKVSEAASAGVDYIQLRERDLSSRDFEEFAAAILARVRATGSATRVLINSRTDIALAIGADGVHLRSTDISPADVRRIWNAARVDSTPVIAKSCHTEQDIVASAVAGADFTVFGPIFGKSDMAGVGLSALKAACTHGIRVLALGGINPENALACRNAGAVGIAGIRLFQANNAKRIADILGVKA